MLPLLTLDFEASCLPRHGRSFPIEVAIADLSGRTRSWLIRPDPAWSDWGWTAEAEALHGLNRELLYAEGMDVRAVLAELADAVGGREVFADHHLDSCWLNTLAEAAGQRPPFRVSHVASLLDRWQPTASTMEAAVINADALVPHRHRAAADARWLSIVVRGLLVRKDERSLFGWSRAEAEKNIAA